MIEEFATIHKQGFISLTATIVILCCSVSVIFASEIASSFKKLFEIYGVKLLAPLIFASLIVSYYEEFILFIFWKLLLYLTYFYEALLNFKNTNFIIILANILFIMLFSFLPIILFEAYKKKYNQQFLYSKQIQMFLWLFITTFIIISQNL